MTASLRFGKKNTAISVGWGVQKMYRGDHRQAKLAQGETPGLYGDERIDDRSWSAAIGHAYSLVPLHVR